MAGSTPGLNCLLARSCGSRGHDLATKNTLKQSPERLSRNWQKAHGGSPMLRPKLKLKLKLISEAKNSKWEKTQVGVWSQSCRPLAIKCKPIKRFVHAQHLHMPSSSSSSSSSRSADEEHTRKNSSESIRIRILK